MNLKQSVVLLCMCTLFLSEHFVFSREAECVQRRLGACKAINVDDDVEEMFLKDFQMPQPEGFILKTSIEINLMENKHSFENIHEMQVERKRKIAYNLDNADVVSISIVLDDGDDIRITLGQKYYGLAELGYYNKEDKLIDRKKYNRFTPILPTFPYHLHMEMSTNGTFSIYADANTEPFFQYELRNRPNIRSIIIFAPISQTDLIAFVDCSDKYKTNCGSHRIDTLHGCREWFVEDNAFIDLAQFQNTYEQKDVQFDEFIVVENGEWPSLMWLFFSEYVSVTIKFKDNSVEAELSINSDERVDIVKSVRTKKWLEIPAKPYAIRLLVTNGTNSSVTISNIRGTQILTLSLCGTKSLQTLHFNGPNLYFDCLHPDNVNSTLINERPRKTIEEGYENITYHEYGYNFSKPLLDIRDFVSGPLFLYSYAFGNSTEDWCEGETRPNVLESSIYTNDSLHFVIESSNKALLTQLERISAQTNATSDTNKAIANSNEALLLELKKVTAQLNATTDTNKAIVDSNEAILSELNNIKASIDALATMEINTTSV